MERRGAQAFSDRKEGRHRKVHRLGASRRSIPPAYPEVNGKPGVTRAVKNRASGALAV